MLLLKATRDEEAYNAFMRAYGDMMRGQGGLFASIPDAVRGQDPYEQNDDEWKYLEDLGIYYNSKTGEAFKSTYLEEYDEYDEERIDIPTPVGAGLEGKVFQIPGTDYVAKIPMQRQNDEIRIENRERPPDRVMRSPLEAWWSQVLNRANYPVNPYSVFASRHPVSNDLSLNLVQPYVDDYHPQFEENRMNAIHQHLFDMKDLPLRWDDMLYEMQDEDFSPEEIRWLARDYDLYEDPSYVKGNMYGNIVIDHMSETPFIEDEYGGLLEQGEIDRLLQAALIEQQNVPKRYRKFGGNIDSRIQTIIDELMESQKQGRLVGSRINFADDRRNVERSRFGRGQP